MNINNNFCMKTEDRSDEESNDGSVSSFNSKQSDASTDNKQKQNSKKSKIQFKFTGFVKEDHGRAIYGLSFNTFIKDRKLFATVGKNRLSIYECLDSNAEFAGDNKSKKPSLIRLLKAYCDPDEEEIYYTCCWTYNNKNQCLVICGGLRAVIRIINIDSIETEANLIGHTHPINELKIHPKYPNLLVSASKDHTLRLWDIKRFSCVAIFGGVEGHRDEIISVDFDFDGRFIVSGGMDHFVRLWSLEDPEIQEKIQSTQKNDVYKQHYPYFSTRDIHVNYIDSVKAYGDLIISKGCDETLAIWKPGHIDDDIMKPDEKISTIICTMQVPKSEIWFVKFSMDISNKLLAVGNVVGKVFVYNFDVDDPKKIRPITLAHEKCRNCVRQTAFSADGTTLIAVTEDGVIWRYDQY